MGLVFGPVLLSLPGILFKIFKIERSLSKKENKVPEIPEPLQPVKIPDLP
jgi:hypothetical protein